jgi:hypothetical protein
MIVVVVVVEHEFVVVVVEEQMLDELNLEMLLQQVLIDVEDDYHQIMNLK